MTLSVLLVSSVSAALPALSIEDFPASITTTNIQLPENWSSTMPAPTSTFWTESISAFQGPTFEELEFQANIRRIENNLQQLIDDWEENGPPEWLSELPDNRSGVLESAAYYAEWSQTDPAAATAWVTAVPEPASYSLILGLISFAVFTVGRRRSR